MAAPRKYPDELRERAVRLVFESGRPIAHVARDLGMHPEALRLAVRRAEADAGTRARSPDERRARAHEGARARGQGAAARQRDPEGRQRVFRLRARPAPTEVSAFIDERRADLGVEPICRTLGVSASAYYHRATGARSARTIEDERLTARIREIHGANYSAYGYRRTWKALQRDGEQVGRGRVQRLMRAGGIQGAKRRGRPWRTTLADPRVARRPDLVERDFAAAAPNRLWVADFTYLRSWEGVVFFSFVIDVFSRRIVGWQFAPHMRTDLVLDALRMALGGRRGDPEIVLIHHSDAGSQLHQRRLHPRTHRPPDPRLDRIGRRRL